MKFHFNFSFRYYCNSISETDRQKYTPVFVNSPEEYRSQLDPKEHQIFVIDDIFGEACLDLSRVEMWQPYLENMLVELTARRPRTLVVICVNKVWLLNVNLPAMTFQFVT